MLIKVCGMRDPENIRQVLSLGIDWMGFIFYSGSRRCFGAIDGKLDLLEEVDFQTTKRVGVFVNASFEEIVETAARYRLDYLQLHGDETPDDCYALHKRGFAVIKAFPVGAADDMERVSDYEGRVDYFLFDTKCKGYGGSGRQFDWSVLSAYRGRTPFLLSGGLHPGSWEAIHEFHHPQFAGIDLNSGFEIEPGMKDVARLRSFLNHI